MIKMQLSDLQAILTYLDSLEIVEDADAFEYLSGIRDQAARIMRNTVQWIEEDAV